MFTQILNWSFFAGLLRIATVWEGRIEDTKRIKVFLLFMTTDPLQRARDISRQIVVLSAELDRLLLAGSRPRSVSPPPLLLLVLALSRLVNSFISLTGTEVTLANARVSLG